LLRNSHLAAVLSDAAPHLRPEFVGSVTGILNVAYGYASGCRLLAACSGHKSDAADCAAYTPAFAAREAASAA